MMYQRPNYFDINDWIIMDTKVLHMFDENETPFYAMKIKIGTLDVEEIDINNHYKKKSFDIIRWINKSEFDRLRTNAGVIVW